MAENEAGETRRAVSLRLFWWTLYALAFGLTEAVLVVYVRKFLGIAPGEDYAAWFVRQNIPLTSATFTEAFQGRGLLGMEQAREIATLLLLLGAAFAGGRSWREKWAVFWWTFAVWDISYYGYLFWLIGFPQSLTATDVYFLVPITWYGPVWFPLCVVMPALLLFSLWLIGKARKSEKADVLQ